MMKWHQQHGCTLNGGEEQTEQEYPPVGTQLNNKANKGRAEVVSSSSALQRVLEYVLTQSAQRPNGRDFK